MISFDFIFNEKNDLSIVDGDLEIGQSDNDNIQTILEAFKGQFYEHPLIGYGIGRKVYGPLRRNVERAEIRSALKDDNYNILYLDITNEFEITIDADKVK